MKAEDLKTKTVDELQKLLLDTRKDQMNDRFQKKNGALDDTSQVRKKRRAVARIKTLLSAKQNEEQKTVKAAPAKKTTKKKEAA